MCLLKKIPTYYNNPELFQTKSKQSSLRGSECFMKTFWTMGKKRNACFDKKIGKNVQETKIMSYMQRDEEPNEDKKYCEKRNHCYCTGTYKELLIVSLTW